MKNNYCLPDININKDSKIVFCGMASGSESYKIQHYYADPNNCFWKVLHEIGITNFLIVPTNNKTKRSLNYKELKDKKIGLTDLVKNHHGMDHQIKPQPSDRDRLLKLIEKFKPAILAFNGKRAACAFLDLKKTKDIRKYGNQKGYEVGKTKIFVLPSTSSAAKKYWDKEKWLELKIAN